MSLIFTAIRLKPSDGGKYASCIDPRGVYESVSKYGWQTDHWWGKANSFTLYSGPEPGTGYLLLPRDTVSAWDRNLTYTLAMVMQYASGRSAVNLYINNLYITDVNTIYSDSPTEPSSDCMCLVTVKDKRVLFGMSVINDAYNLEAANPPSLTLDDVDRYHQSTLDSGALWTWQTLLNDIWSLLPSGASPGTSPTLPYSPDTFPRDIRFLGQSAWTAYNAVLDKLGCVLIYDPTADVFSLERLGATQANIGAILTAAVANGDFLASSIPLACTAANIPEKFKVHFPKRYKHYGTEHETDPAGTNWTTSPNHVETINTSVTEAIAGSILPLWDDMAAIIEADGTTANSAALTARATEVANNYRERINGSGIAGNPEQKAAYKGIISGVLPGSEVDSVCYGDVGKGICTIIQHQKKPTTSSFTKEQRGNISGIFGKQDIDNRTYPNWPRLIQIIKIVDSAANTDGTYNAILQRFDPETLEYSDAEDVWAYPTSSSAFQAGSVCIGRMIGTHDFAADIRPLYIVTASNSIQRFKNESGETVPPWAVMKVIGVDVIDDEPLIVIEKADDDWRSVFVFNSGEEVGFEEGVDDIGVLQNTPIVKVKTNTTEAPEAWLNPEDGQWYVSSDRSLPSVITCHGMAVSTGSDKHCLGHWQVRTKARRLSFTLDEPLAESDLAVDVTVTDYHNGSNPGLHITVVNGLEFVGEEDAKGFAEHCEEENAYRIYQMVCPPEE